MKLLEDCWPGVSKWHKLEFPSPKSLRLVMFSHSEAAFSTSGFLLYPSVEVDRIAACGASRTFVDEKHARFSRRGEFANDPTICPDDLNKYVGGSFVRPNVNAEFVSPINL